MNLNCLLLKQNIFLIFIFFIKGNFLIFGQSENECYNINIKDTSNKTINPIYFNLIKKGFLVPDIKIKKEKNSIFIQVCPGKKFKKIIIRDNTNTKTENYKPEEFGGNLQLIHKQLINNGFPFAHLKLDSISFEENSISAQLNIQRGPFFEWGELIVKGNAQISEHILRNILSIKRGEPFNEEAFISVENKLSQTPYLTVFQKPELLFENGKTSLYIYLNSKSINNISGTIGLQQNINTEKYFIIGDLRMKLVNQLKRGESFDFQWRRIQENTQSLKAGLNYPSLLKTKFGIDNNFNLYKKDSTFIEIKNQFGIQYITSKGFIFKANYKYLESTTLNSKSNNLTSGNSTNYFYGLALTKQKLDYLPAPKKGFQFLVDISLGKRSTSRLDSLNQKFDNTFKSEYLFAHYLSFFKRNIIKLQFSGEIYFASFYYNNELLRFGGIQNQRGFREDELLGNIRSTQSIEYRYMIEQNSYLFAFYDFTYYENQQKVNLKDLPFGFGTGLSFGTNQGIFSISYAIGKQFNNPILLRNGIIHFGYVSYF